MCDLLTRSTGQVREEMGGVWGREFHKNSPMKDKLENQCRKITRKLVKSFTCWVKTRMVEKHAHQHICQLHPVDPENEFSARKKKVSPHFSRIQSQCLQPKACRRLSGSIRNFPVGLQETRCLKRWPPKMAERNRCSFKGHRWVWERVYLIGRWNNQHIQAMLWSLPTSMKGLECNNSTGWVDLLIIWCFNFSWTTSSTRMWLADNLQVYLMPVFSTPSYLFDNQSSQEPPHGNMEVASIILLVKTTFLQNFMGIVNNLTSLRFLRFISLKLHYTQCSKNSLQLFIIFKHFDSRYCTCV